MIEFTKLHGTVDQNGKRNILKCTEWYNSGARMEKAIQAIRDKPPDKTTKNKEKPKRKVKQNQISTKSQNQKHTPGDEEIKQNNY